MAVTCTVTDATMVSATDSTSVAISPAPSVIASANHAAAAPGSNVTFTASATGGPGTFTGYAWSFGDGTTGSGAQITHMYTQTGAFQTTVVVTDGNDATTSGSASVTISNIQVTGSATPPSGTTETAFGFTATATGGGGHPYGYGWDFGDGKTSTGCTTSHAWKAAGHFVVNLSMGDTGGNQTWQNGSVDVQTNLGPPGGPLTVSFVASTLVAGENETVYLVATGGGGSGGYRCSWDFADGNFGTGCSVSYAWNRTGAYNVTLTFTDSAGNNATAMQTLEIVIVLTASFEVGPSPAILGESAQLIAHPSGGIGPYKFTRDFGGGARAPRCTASHAWKTRGRVVVWLFVNDSAGEHRGA